MMMNSNKNILQASNRKSCQPCTNYRLQFSYSSPNKQKYKLPTASSVSSHSLQIKSHARHTLNIPSLKVGRAEDYQKSFSLAVNSESREGNSVRFKAAVGGSHIVQDFLQRKVKTNEHQLFKVLAKLQDSQSRRCKTNHVVLEQLHHLTNRSLGKEGLKPPRKLTWVRSRYCTNRGREYGVLPESGAGGKGGGRTDWAQLL